MLAKLKIPLDIVSKGFFPGSKKNVLLIVFPACFIVIFYFYSNLSDTLTTKKHDRVVEYEKKFAPLKKDLPKQAIVNYYVGDQDYQIRDFFIASYVLIPVRVIRGLKPDQKYLIVFDDIDQAIMPEFNGYNLKRKYKNGIMLFERQS